jgi:hypothetical protein
MLGWPPLSAHLMENVFFDTCVCHQPRFDLLFEVIDVRNILFGSEMVGAGPRHHWARSMPTVTCSVPATSFPTRRGAASGEADG